MMVYPLQEVANPMPDAEVSRCEFGRADSSGEATQNYRESLETVQHVDFWEFRGVRQDTRGTKKMPAARKFPNRSKSAGFCLGRQQVVWHLHPGGALPGLIEASYTRHSKSRSAAHPGGALPGLIEATPRTWCWTAAWAASGGRAPRPH